jgi:hypothetical protein
MLENIDQEFVKDMAYSQTLLRKNAHTEYLIIGNDERCLLNNTWTNKDGDLRSLLITTFIM